MQDCPENTSKVVFLAYNEPMPEALLRTKLFVPQRRPKLVSRPVLVERLNQRLKKGRKLAPISAPAGYGNTTLVAEGLPDPAWLSLDKGENGASCFCRMWYLSLVITLVRFRSSHGRKRPLGSSRNG